jgi:hypothetical protein
MSEDHGPNVRQLNYLGVIGGSKSSLSQQADGSWAAVPAGGPESEEDISRGATPEEAAGARLERLEELGEFVPEPPDDHMRLPGRSAASLPRQEGEDATKTDMSAEGPDGQVYGG